MTIDVERARRDTPATQQLIHFNNAGAALPPAPVLEAVIGHLRLEAAIGGYEAAAEAAPGVADTYAALARLLGCAACEIALFENATRAWDAAFYSLRFGPGDRILTGKGEYASNVLAFLQMSARTGARVEVVPDDETGQLDVKALEQLIDERVRLIAVTHIPTNGGLINPASAIGAVARRAGIPYLLDACQSAGQLPLDVSELGCDMLSATGRKYLRGPRSTGFLYVRGALLESLDPPFIDLHSAAWTGPATYAWQGNAKRFENWEGFVAGRIGLGVAVDYALDLGMTAIAARVTELGALLRASLAALHGVTLHDKGAQKCGIVSFSVAGEAAADVQRRLQRQGINTSVSAREATRFDMDERGLDALVRASVHYYNTEQEIERMCAVVAGYRA